jgi:hypothetical protein
MYACGGYCLMPLVAFLNAETTLRVLTFTLTSMSTEMVLPNVICKGLVHDGTQKAQYMRNWKPPVPYTTTNLHGQTDPTYLRVRELSIKW